MKIILKERVKNVGNIGEIVNVSAGYARNYLFPRLLAILASDSNRKFVAAEQARLQKKILEEKNAALAVKKSLDGLTIELTKKVGGNGKLFGTVTNAELARELTNKGFDVERKSIHIEGAIRQIGEYTVKVKLFFDVESHIKIKVKMDEVQAEEMKKKQELGLKKKKEREEQAKFEKENPQPAKTEDSENDSDDL
jgi:large subunit ribosomal protein L9